MDANSHKLDRRAARGSGRRRPRLRRSCWRIGAAAALCSTSSFGMLLVSPGLAHSAAGTFVSTGSLSVGSYDEAQNLVRLCDGSFLATGGTTPGGFTASTERYNESTGTWTLVAPMSTPRAAHSATLLADCRVLVAGGANLSSGGLAAAEVYDPGSNVWTTVGSLNTGRQEHTAFRLPDGNVLVAAGGVPGAGDTFGTTSSELYDPATETWSITGSLDTGRVNQSAAQLADGRVVVAGGMPRGAGVSGPGFSSVEVYDPGTGTWAYTAGPMASGRRGGHSMTALADGRVLVVGGHIESTGESTALAEVFDPASGNLDPDGGDSFSSSFSFCNAPSRWNGVDCWRIRLRLA